MATSPVVTPRDAYPLYFSIARPLVWIIGGDPAHALNVVSALEAALAVALLVLVATELSGSIVASLLAAALFASSYTFWSQAVIAEVYALHMVCIALTLLLLLRWEQQPTTHRLAWFLAGYAFSFGHHLTMILFAPAYAVFLLLGSPNGWRGWRTILTWRHVALATLLTAAGASQYLWNLHTLWLAPVPPRNLWEGLQTFWFDVTKSDWRDTMVMNLPEGMMSERLHMFAFDVMQQFGALGPPLAFGGVIALIRVSPVRAVLLTLAYLCNVLFALSYNVGDSHVFFLPSHLLLALLAAPGIVGVVQLVPASRRALARMLLTAAVASVVAVRAYDDYPALDRAQDRRPLESLEALTKDVSDRNAILVTDVNWQLENGLNYFARRMRSDVAVAHLSDVVLYAPALIRDNQDIGRQVVLAGNAADELANAYGPILSTTRQPDVPPQLSDIVTRIPAGTRYVLCVLRPLHEYRIDDADLNVILSHLTGGEKPTISTDSYAAVAGLSGQTPALVESSSRPFRASVTLAGTPVTIRMESWLAFDTIRRMGFGHVIANHQHTLIAERGVSFVTFDDRGTPRQTSYAAGILAPQPRYIVSTRLQ